MNNGYNNFQQQPPQWQPPQAPINDGKGLSVAALVLGLLGILGSWVFLLPGGVVLGIFTIIFSILSVVFGVIGRKKSKLVYGKASGLATAGLVLGIISLSLAALNLICTLACDAALCSAANEVGELADLMGNSYYW